MRTTNQATDSLLEATKNLCVEAKNAEALLSARRLSDALEAARQDVEQWLDKPAFDPKPSASLLCREVRKMLGLMEKFNLRREDHEDMLTDSLKFVEQWSQKPAKEGKD